MCARPKRERDCSVGPLACVLGVMFRDGCERHLSGQCTECVCVCVYVFNLESNWEKNGVVSRQTEVLVFASNTTCVCVFLRP